MLLNFFKKKIPQMFQKLINNKCFTKLSHKKVFFKCFTNVFIEKLFSVNDFLWHGKFSKK
jgi:hypothetical protein